jgi:hypothetical protein
MDQATYAAQNAELARLREFQKGVQAQLDAKEKERLKILGEKEGVEKALAEQAGAWEKKHAEVIAERAAVESAWLAEKTNAAINEALAGRQYNSEDPAETAKLVRGILALELEAVRGPDGQPVVRHKGTLKPAADYLKERLDSKALAGLFKPTSAAGAGGSGSQPANGTPAPPPEPGSVQDQLLKYMAARSPAWGLERAK